jgi:hypothetical protein
VNVLSRELQASGIRKYSAMFEEKKENFVKIKIFGQHKTGSAEGFNKSLYLDPATNTDLVPYVFNCNSWLMELNRDSDSTN